MGGFLFSLDGFTAVNLAQVQSLYVTGASNSWWVEVVTTGSVAAQISPTRTSQSAAAADLATVVAGYRPFA